MNQSSICRSAKVGDEIGGHHVSGHVHTTAQVQKIEITENNKRITFQVCSACACLHAHPCLPIRISADGTVLIQKSNPRFRAHKALPLAVWFQDNSVEVVCCRYPSNG